MDDSPSITTMNVLSSVPCLLLARHVKFPSSFIWMRAVFVLFIRVVEFLITAMYIGRVPLAVHTSSRRGRNRTTGAGDTTFGEAKTRMVRSLNSTNSPHK